MLQLIAEPLAARALAESDTPTMLSVTGDLDDELLSDLVEEMAPDDAADLLGDLPVEQSEKLLDLMDDADSAVFRELLEHDDDSGGGIMTSHVVSVPISATVGEAIAHLREWARNGGEEFQSLFVIEASGVLGGTVPLSRLLVAQPERRISELVVESPVSVAADLDQEEIARIFQEYDLLIIPVVERGVTLSGGQKQRAAIARAVVGKHPSSFSMTPWPASIRIRKTRFCGGCTKSSIRAPPSSSPIASPRSGGPTTSSSSTMAESRKRAVAMNSWRVTGSTLSSVDGRSWLRRSTSCERRRDQIPQDRLSPAGPAAGVPAALWWVGHRLLLPHPHSQHRAAGGTVRHQDYHRRLHRAG